MNLKGLPRQIKICLGICLGIVLLAFFVQFKAVLASKTVPKDVELQVGIVQRLGDESTDLVKIKSIKGDLLTVSFLDRNLQKYSFQASQIQLEIAKEILSNSILDEKLVLSNHSAFESAEASADNWQKKGIETEIAQSNRWQVWAKRDVYSTPLLRRLLLTNLQSQGLDRPYLETKVVSEGTHISFVTRGKRFTVDSLEIKTKKSLFELSEGSENSAFIRYAGNLRLQPNAYGDFTLVNLVPLETYLRGVVPFEIGADAPVSAVQSQAIIARTYALRNLRRFAVDDYQLCASVHCQVYKGLSGTNKTIDRGIAATAGKVLTYQNELVDALYSSANGGVTAYFEDVWDGKSQPYLKPIVDAPGKIWDLSSQPLTSEVFVRRFLSLNKGFNEKGNVTFRWQKKVKLQNLNSELRDYILRSNNSLTEFTTVEVMSVKKRSPSGRILTMEVQTDRGAIELNKNEIRSAFKDIYSTFFYLEPIYDNLKILQGYDFIGGGFGHGVGLSQHGSRNLAKLGWSASQILQFYYPNTKVQKLNDSIVFWQDDK
jgi:SpoIID/LytB domain protein